MSAMFTPNDEFLHYNTSYEMFLHDLINGIDIGKSVAHTTWVNDESYFGVVGWFTYRDSHLDVKVVVDECTAKATTYSKLCTHTVEVAFSTRDDEQMMAVGHFGHRFAPLAEQL